MTHKLALLFTLLLINFSCSQEGKKEKNMEELNSSNYVEYMLKHVKHYEHEPEYVLRINNSTQYEVFVNDIPVLKHYAQTQLISPVEINYVILGSGSQKITFKALPYDSKGFSEGDGIIIRVLVRDKKDVERLGLAKAPEKLLLEKEFLVNKKGDTHFEGGFTFEASVPYQNKGWSDGQDLTKFDRKELEAAVVAFYRKMWNIYNDKSKKEAKFPLFFKREIEIATADYADKDHLNKILKEYLLPYENPTYTMLPLENYKMVLYGEGRAVALEQATLEMPLRGYSALGAKYKTDMGSTLGDMSQMILYLPPGKNLKDGLEIIR